MAGHTTVTGLILCVIAALLSSDAYHTRKSRRIHNSNVKGEKRMSNGKQALLEEYKFILKMEFNPARMNYKVCQASILNNQWAVTASHCVCNITNYPGHLKLFPLGHEEKVIYVDQIIPHPEAQRILGWPERIRADGAKTDKSFFDYDIALLRFTTPIALDENMKAIRIPEQNFDLDTARDVQCKSAGWGSTKRLKNFQDAVNNNYKVSKHLVEITAVIKPISVCNSKEGGFDDYKLSNLLLCGEQKKIMQGPCLGDSGSPVKCKVAGDNEEKLYGIMTVGGWDCNPKYGMYAMTRVSKFSNWIKKTIGEDTFDGIISKPVEF